MDEFRALLHALKHLVSHTELVLLLLRVVASACSFVTYRLFSFFLHIKEYYLLVGIWRFLDEAYICRQSIYAVKKEKAASEAKGT